jgi:hypothetical protein
LASTPHKLWPLGLPGRRAILAPAALRVATGGALAMALTAALGRILGAAVT